MRKIVLLFSLFLSLLSSAQSPEAPRLSIRVITDQKQPIENATVELRTAKDSALVKVSLSNPTGQADFHNLPEGTYITKVTAVQHNTTISNPFAITPASAPQTIEVALLPKADKQMQGITVTAQKPFLQKLVDRVVVNVDNSIVSAGSTALEVLERSPGVIVDQDAISLRGRAGVIIMIDGKPSPLSGADLAAYLRSLPSSAIESIHLITNPSARYEAAGNSGIIDIRMKKDQRLGSNGTLTAGYGIGIYPKASGGTTFNYRNKKLNFFGNYNHSRRHDENVHIQTREFFNNGVLVGSDYKNNDGISHPASHSARLGVDFFPSAKTIIGFIVNSSFSRSTFVGDNISIVNNAQKIPYYYFKTANNAANSGNTHVANINLKHTFSQGRELTIDADYGTFRRSDLSWITTAFYDMSNTANQPSDILDINQQGDLFVKSAKADYSQSSSKGGRLEAGLKTSYVSSDNDARFFNILPSGPQVDLRKTNRFFYNEYNNAAYLNYSREYKKFSLQLGLRAEHTDINTRQVVKDIHWDSSCLRFFPSAFFNFKLAETKTLGISISRRIDRPGYGLLNPFVAFIDATAYTTGNSQLLPQFTWSSELSYTLKNHFIAFSYSRTTHPQYPVIGRVLDLIPGFEIPPGADSNITVQEYLNLDLLNNFSLSGSSPVRLTKWWNMINSANFFLNHVKASVGGIRLDNGNPTIFARTNNSFTLTKTWSAELNGSVPTGRRSGYLLSRTRWGLDAGVQKKVFDGAGTFRFNVTDIFRTLIPRAYIAYESRYVENWHAYRDTRVMNLTFTYRFGNSKVQAERKRTTASEEERRRAG